MLTLYLNRIGEFDHYWYSEEANRLIHRLNASIIILNNSWYQYTIDELDNPEFKDIN